MKKFKFSLESVLKYKTFLEKEAKQALMSVNLDIKECEGNIEQIKFRRENIFKELEKASVKSITIENFQLYQNYIAGIEQRLEDEKKRLENLFREKDLKTKKLIKAKTEKEALEKLKSKKKEKYIEDMLYEEQKEIDEISSLKKAREISNEI
ncbi:MAG: flagellar export protein FliJ [Thermodesulfobacteriota bacterium]